MGARARADDPLTLSASTAAPLTLWAAVPTKEIAVPTNDPRPTKAQRRDDAREKALQMRKAQERAARRNKIVAAAVLLVVVLGAVAVVWFTIQQSNKAKEQYGSVVYGAGASDVVAPALADVTAPSTADDTGAIPVSAAGVGEVGADDVVVTIYFDFMCPYCGQFDAANSADLDALAQTDGVTLKYRPISFLDTQSKNTNYSTRAANAAAIVADKDAENFTAFVTALYENQPSEGTAGPTDAEIAEIAEGVGVPATVTATFTDTVEGTFTTAGSETEQTGTWRTFSAWVAATTNQMTADVGRIGTPTVLIDGTVWPSTEQQGLLYEPGQLKAAVEAAVAAKG